jgi:hypothetical protein
VLGSETAIKDSPSRRVQLCFPESQQPVLHCQIEERLLSFPLNFRDFTLCGGRFLVPKSVSTYFAFCNECQGSNFVWPPDLCPMGPLGGVGFR